MLNVSRFLLCFLLLTGVLVMLAEREALSPLDNGQISIEFDIPYRPIIGNSYSLRNAARQAGVAWGSDPDGARALITRYLVEYPLDTRAWLDLARIEASQHGRESYMLAAHLQAAAAVRPGSRPTHWQATQIALQAGDTELAERHLALWLKGRASDTARALFVARRWIDDADELLDRIVPPGIEFLSRTMAFAMQQGDDLLMEAVWPRMEDRVDLTDSALLDYVDFLFDRGHHDEAKELWARHDPHYRPGDIANGDFSRELGPARGLNWRVSRLPSGARVQRDEEEFYYRPASLQVSFDGEHNLRLRSPWIRIPVTPGIRYELSGYWQADRLTTRSLPYWQIEAEGARFRERVELPGNHFEWTRWSKTFVVPEDTRMLRLRLQRNATNAFDRYIGGILWLDGVQLTELPILPVDVDTGIDSDD
jgi:hypothetical protein